jgi:cold shock CspA family protein
MYQGTIVWWNQTKGQGAASVENTRYFILASRIISGPDDIQAGDDVEFKDFLKPKRPDLLPVAIGVVILRRVNAGITALAGSGGAL